MTKHVLIGPGPCKEELVLTAPVWPVLLIDASQTPPTRGRRILRRRPRPVRPQMMHAATSTPATLVVEEEPTWEDAAWY